MRVFERPNFFTGKLLTAEDLSAEQQYQIDKRRLHNRLLHGWGVVSGLDVMIGGGDGIRISAGLALDCEGNEIVMAAPVELTLPSGSETSLYVHISYKETSALPLASTGEVEWDLIVESFELLLGTNNSNAGHRRSGGRWITCGLQHPLTLARLRKISSRWRVDRRYRPPRLR